MSQIEFNNVVKEYEAGFRVLDDVTFKIENGEFVFLVGPSGAGKSTLVRLLTREEVPNSGEIIFNNINVPEISSKEELSVLRRKIGVVFQDFKLLDSRNVFDNVAIALEVVSAPDQEIRDIIPNVLGMVGLSEKMFKFPNQLSGGEKQRLSIARALAHEPDVLVADEPTGMIDPDSAGEVINILEKINSLGTTVIMATHDAQIVNSQKKRVLRIEDGKLVSDKQGGKYHG